MACPLKKGTKATIVITNVAAVAAAAAAAVAVAVLQSSPISPFILSLDRGRQSASGK